MRKKCGKDHGDGIVCIKECMFGVPGTAPNDRVCSVDKTVGMMNFKVPCCEGPGNGVICTTAATCSGPDGVKRWCKIHKDEGAACIPSLAQCCKSAGCIRRGYYSKDGESGSWCSDHNIAASELTQRKPQPLCEFKGCKVEASYGEEEYERRFCAEHRAHDYTARKLHKGEDGVARRTWYK